MKAAVSLSLEDRLADALMRRLTHRRSWPPPENAVYWAGCAADGACATSDSFAAVAAMLCATPVSASTPTCIFIPKCHWFPFLVWCISGSHVPERFFVDVGASTMLASTTVPSRSVKPRAARLAFTTAISLSPRRASPADAGTSGSSSRPAAHPASASRTGAPARPRRACPPSRNQPLHALEEPLPPRPPLLRPVLQLRERRLRHRRHRRPPRLPSMRRLSQHPLNRSEMP